MNQYCFGIDVGGTSIKCGLFLEDGTLVEKWEIPTRTEEEGSKILPDVAKSIQDKIQEKGLDKSRIDGVGIGLPGPVNAKGEILCAVNLNWGFKDVSKELSELTGLPAKAGNDANVAALGEAWKGAAEGAQNVVMVTLGTGVGGGIIVDGKIVSGSHGCGGEVGHANVKHEETISCNCGNKGCLEQYASATGIARLAAEALAASKEDSVLRNVEKVTAKDVFDAYKENDSLATEIVRQFADCLGGTLGIFASVIDPDKIVVGGGVSKAGSVLTDVLTQAYKKYAFGVCKETPIVLASLGNDAGIYGAAKLVIED